MRVLLINNYYNFGSTGKIVCDTRHYLDKSGVETYVAYGRGVRHDDSHLYKFCYELEAKIQGLYSILSGNYYGGSIVSTKRLIKYIEKVKPDIVHVHCINAFCVNIPMLMCYLADKDIKTVVTHHAEFLYTGNCAHAYDCDKWQFNKGCYDCEQKEGKGLLGINMLEYNWNSMMTSIAKFKSGYLVSVAVSPWVKQRIQLSPFWNKYPCLVVKNGINTETFHYRKDSKTILQIAAFNKYKKICLHVTPRFTSSVSLKGGQFLFPIAEKMSDILFVIVSTAKVNEANAPDNVIIWGRAKSQEELAALYSIADVTLLTSKRETFSMVCAESLCCGTPVVGFNAGGPESIALREYSSFVNYGDIDLIRIELDKMIGKGFNHETVASVALPRYDRLTMGKETLGVYKQIEDSL